MVFAETIYLKDGKILRGQITEETNEIITLETDEQWKEINRKDIKKIVRDTEPTKMKSKRIGNEEENNLTSLNFSPKIGIYYPTDKDLSDIFGVNILYGFNTIIWKNQLGFQFEYEKYADTMEEKIDIIDSIGIKTGTIKIEQELVLNPIWFSLLYRGTAKIYGFIGGGIGFIDANLIDKEASDTGLDESLRDNYIGLQIFTGFAGKNAGLTLKYSSISTKKDWGDINLGGITTTFNLYF